MLEPHSHTTFGVESDAIHAKSLTPSCLLLVTSIIQEKSPPVASFSLDLSKWEHAHHPCATGAFANAWSLKSKIDWVRLQNSRSCGALAVLAVHGVHGFVRAVGGKMYSSYIYIYMDVS